MAPIWEFPKPKPDPMREKEEAAARRKVADSLHALARRIENGDVLVREFAVRFESHEVPESRFPEARILDPAGMEKLVVRYYKRPK